MDGAGPSQQGRSPPDGGNTKSVGCETEAKEATSTADSPGRKAFPAAARNDLSSDGDGVRAAAAALDGGAVGRSQGPPAVVVVGQQVGVGTGMTKLWGKQSE